MKSYTIFYSGAVESLDGTSASGDLNGILFYEAETIPELFRGARQRLIKESEEDGWRFSLRQFNILETVEL